MAKKHYHVRNWNDYNKALKERGNITLWMAPSVAAQWYEKTGTWHEQGHPFVYSAVAIETCLTLRVLFHLPLRQCQGFVDSLLAFLYLSIKAPCYTQLCRRQATLPVQLTHNVKGPIHLVIDPSGLKVFGEGEWKVRQHGYSKKRTWRKLHLGIDVQTRQIVMSELTESQRSENTLLKKQLSQYPNGYTTVGADKAYDSYDNHQIVGHHYHATSAILLQRKARIRQRASTKDPPLVRDNILREMRRLGRNGWKEKANYHQRSLIENTFFRYKTIFGDKLHAHTFKNQIIETLLCCNILNTFTQRGMPRSFACS